MTEYDRIPYPSAPLPHTHPHFLGGLALQHGLDVPSGLRVLDIGCGAGRNLAWIAATLPGAKCMGVDLAGSAIRDAQEFAARIEVANVEFRHADFRATGPGEFDYIIANGLYSWTPPEVRAALLQFIDERLSPLGIAMVSFHHENRPWRSELLKISDPAERLRKARSLQGLEDFEDPVLLHDHLAEISDPIFRFEFEESLPQGLECITDASDNPEFSDAVVVRSGRLRDVPLFDKMWFVTESSYPATVQDCEDTVVEAYSGAREIVNQAGECPVVWGPARILARDGDREIMNYFGALVELEDEDRALLVSLDGSRRRGEVPAETLEFFAKAGLLIA